MAIKYKYECFWSQKDGWHFSFKNKRLWQCSPSYAKAGFRVADVNKNDEYTNHQTFGEIEEALEYMRTGKI